MYHLFHTVVIVKLTTLEPQLVIILIIHTDSFHQTMMIPHLWRLSASVSQTLHPTRYRLWMPYFSFVSCNTQIPTFISFSALRYASIPPSWPGQGTRIATLDIKLVQKLGGICHKPPFQVSLDVHKEYNSLDRRRYMGILKGYGLGKNIRRLIHRFWEDQSVVSKMGSCYVQPFKTGRGVTHGDLVSSTLFSIVVNAVVIAVLLEVCGVQEAQPGLG